MKAPTNISLKKQIPSNLSLIGRRIVSGLLFFIFVAVAAADSDELPKGTDHFLNDMMTPFWAKDTMINESVLMVSNGTESPKARLLFPAIKILSVKNAALDKTYKEGVDWVCANDTLESR